MEIGASGFSGAFTTSIKTLLPIVNPIGCAILFPRVVSGMAYRRRLMMAWRVGMGASVALLSAMWIGPSLTAAMGISQTSLELVGGLLVAFQAWRLMEEMSHEKPREHAYRTQGVLPIVFPFTIGAGSIVAAMGIGAAMPPGLAPMLAYGSGASTAALFIGLIIAALYAGADRLLGLAGESVARSLGFVSALVLLGVGTEIVLRAIRNLLD